MDRHDNRLHRSDVARILAESQGIDERTAMKFLDCLFDAHDGIIPNKLREDGGRVVLRGFGTFHSTEIIERTVEDGTGKVLEVTHSRYPRWTGSDVLRKSMRVEE